MRRAHRLLLTLIAVSCTVPITCSAQAACPWMNAATAEGFLGGNVQTAISGVTTDGDATCEYARANSMLRIAVHTMADIKKEFPSYLAQCGTGALNLRGIGNQAVQCMSKGEEVIVSRVRERAFIITIKAAWITTPPTSPTKTRNPISDDSENIAEQVAGSMF
jgi:hypothetical protein